MGPYLQNFNLPYVLKEAVDCPLNKGLVWKEFLQIPETEFISLQLMFLYSLRKQLTAPNKSLLRTVM